VGVHSLTLSHILGSMKCDSLARTCTSPCLGHEPKAKVATIRITEKCKQTNVYVALRVIKQVINKKVEVYYERILKLANYLNHKVDNNLFMTLFQAGLVPNL
jgi:hypothetical protein